MADLRVQIAPKHTRGLLLRNPVMTASGTFGYGIEYEGILDIQRLGAIVCKGTTLGPRDGKPQPRIFETDSGLLNAIGLQNIGVDALVKECLTVSRANEITLGWDFYPYAMEYMRNAGDHKPSMLMDIEANRRTEIDFMNGKFVEYGKQAGIETPYNQTMWALVKGLESK